LLASSGFAEAFARRWLDLTRFAESSGGGRTLLFKDAWRYRDYVIQSIHADVPINRFIREQIAGDLLPAATDEDRARLLTATGFLALGPTNYEEQDKQQLRFDIIDEQLDTIGKAFLGQTIGCARCHDHKFDPIPQRDYYALAGIFSSTRTLNNLTDNVARWVVEPLPGRPEEERAANEHKEKLAQLRVKIEAARTRIARLNSKGTSRWIGSRASCWTIPMQNSSEHGRPRAFSKTMSVRDTSPTRTPRKVKKPPRSPRPSRHRAGSRFDSRTQPDRTARRMSWSPFFTRTARKPCA
jgi:hypothetical protein